MAFQSQPSTEVDVLEVNFQNSAVLIKMGSEEFEAKVIAPANIKFAKVGKSSVKFDENGNVNFIRSLNFNNPNSGYKRPFNFNQARGPPQGFQRSNTFKPEVKKHWEIKREILESVTLQVIDAHEKALEESGLWVFAVQRYPYEGLAEADKKDPKLSHRLYDAVIYFKVLKDGARETPEEEPQNY